MPRATPQRRIRILSGKLSESRGPAGSEVSCFVSSAGWQSPCACPSAAHSALRRDYNDLDFAGFSGQREAVTAFFTGLGYEPDRSPSTPFMAISDSSFGTAAYDRQVDVVFDRLRMSHTFDLRDRLILDERTLPLADLLLCKLQIVEANEKDVVDAITLLADHPLGDDDTAINAAYIARLAADDWGLCHTLERSLERVRRHPLATTPAYRKGCGASDGATAASGRRTKNDALEAAGANR